jgi:hypothetical protein
MKVQVIQVPYDSSHRGVRMGGGPEYLVNSGLVEVLQAEGPEVFRESVEPQKSQRHANKDHKQAQCARAARAGRARRA